MTNVSAETRKRIVYRIGGGKTVVQASAIQNIEELAYAISFLAHHRLYKMSKDEGGVTVEDAEEVLGAFEIAAEDWDEGVIDVLGGSEEPKPISELGEGVVRNPFDYV